MIVDDESHGRQLLEAILIEEGYELIFADNGPGAMDYLYKSTPDLILLDVMMPGMDGFEVCRNIRIDKRFKGIPIILVTALDDRDSRKKGLTSGATDYISKPFDRNEIQVKIRNLLRLNPANSVDPESEQSEHKIKELSDLSTLTEQVFNLLMPVPEHLRHYFQDFFILPVGSEAAKTCIPWIHADTDYLYIMLMKTISNSFKDKMLNLLVITFISRIVQTKQISGSIDLINKLSIFLNNNLKLNDTSLIKNIHSLSVLILDRDTRQIHITGFNQSVIIVEKNEVKKTDLDMIQQCPDINRHFNVISDNMSDSSCVYLSTISVEKIFNSLANRELPGISYREFFGSMTSVTMKEQKLRFEKLLENISDTLEGAGGFEIIGLRI